MELWLIAFLSGCTFSLFLTDVPPFSVIIPGFCLSILLIQRKHLILSGFLCGISLMSLHITLWFTTIPEPSNLSQRAVTIEIISVPTTRNEPEESGWTINQRFLANVSGLHHTKVVTQLFFRLNSPLKQGDTFNATLSFKPARALLNQGSVQPLSYFTAQKIVLTGYGEQDDITQPDVQQLDKQRGNIQQRWFDYSTILTQHQQYAGVLQALLTGNKQGISTTEKHWLQQQGIGHLLAISGLHIGIVFVWSYWLFSLLLRLILLLTQQVQQLTQLSAYPVIGALGIAWLFAFVTGLQPSSLRATSLLTLFVLTKLTHKHVSLPGTLLLTAAISIIVQPFSLLNPGFWLSHIAIITIFTVLFFVSTHGPANLFTRLKQMMIIQLALAASLTPLTIFLFDSSAPAGLITNLIAVPTVSLITVPTLALGVIESTLAGSTHLITLSNATISMLFSIVTDMSNYLSPLVICSVLIAIIIYIVWLQRILSKSQLQQSVVVTIALTMTASVNQSDYVKLNSSPDSTQWTLHVMDPGQGSLAVIIKNNRAILFDTGPAWNTSDAIEKVLLPFLAQQNIPTIDLAFISHGDNDHAGGLNTLMKHSPATQVISRIHNTCQAQAIIWQQLHIDFLQQYSEQHSNDNACIVKVSDEQFSVLFPGDISRKTELALIKENRLPLNSTILIVPHHGSNTSSSETFINRVNPDIAIYSTGYNNRFKFPANKVRARYDDNHTIQFNTAMTGQITLGIEQGKLTTITRFNQDVATAWHQNAVQRYLDSDSKRQAPTGQAKLDQWPIQK